MAKTTLPEAIGEDRRDIVDIIDDLNLRHSWTIHTLAEVICNTEDTCMAEILGGVQAHIHDAKKIVAELDDWRTAGTLNRDDGDLERFLNLIVCAGPRDRFHALQVRKHQGIEAALRYIEQCNITDETYDAPEDAYARGHHDGLWHASEAVQEVRRKLSPVRPPHPADKLGDD